MARWIGINVAGDAIVLVDAEVPDTGPIVVEMDDTWKLQGGDRPKAYAVMRQRLADYLREHGTKQVIIKASAVNMGGTTLAHLGAAELRGVVACAAAEVVDVKLIAKGHMSRTFGERKVDEYVKDDAFWAGEVIGKKLRLGSREAAMVLLAARKADR
jgi:hypothetical protein